MVFSTKKEQVLVMSQKQMQNIKRYADHYLKRNAQMSIVVQPLRMQFLSD